MIRAFLILVTAALLAPLAARAAPAAGGEGEWPGWRGPGSDAAVQAGALAAPGPASLRVAWKRALGSGYSSVSVAGGRAVTLFTDGEDDWVVALDAESGEELWRHRLAATYRGHDGSHDGPISSPLIASGRVYALGPRGHLAALDLESGAKLWSIDLIEAHEARSPYYGFSTSPLMVDGVLVLAFTVAEKSSVGGFDPESGELLWELEHGGDGSPIGSQTMNPVPVGGSRVFLDHREDGSVLLELRLEGDQVVAETVWSSKAFRSSYSTPVHHDGHLYGFTSRFLTCVDAATGETVWKSRQPGDGFLILVDGHLVVTTKKGKLHLAEASPERYREVAALDLFDELAWTPASFAGGRLYARSHGSVAALDLTAASPAVAAAPVRSGVEKLPAGYDDSGARYPVAYVHGGGYGAFYTALQNPGLVSGVASQSTFMLSSHEDELTELLASAEEAPFAIYHDWCTYGLRSAVENWDIVEANRRLDALLAEKGYRPVGGEFRDGFGWGSWKNRTDRVFETLFPLAAAHTAVTAD